MFLGLEGCSTLSVGACEMGAGRLDSKNQDVVLSDWKELVVVIYLFTIT